MVCEYHLFFWLKKKEHWSTKWTRNQSLKDYGFESDLCVINIVIAIKSIGNWVLEKYLSTRKFLVKSSNFFELT